MAKKVNKRCPLQASCERKCDFEGHELDCDFYDVNAVGDCVIDDQEEIRQERERKRQEEMDMAEFPDDEDTEGNLIGVSERNVVMLPVDQLYPHPDNPRKDVGDVSELADSIKKNGIFQNLTVIPGHYLTPEETLDTSADYNLHDWFDNHSGYTVIIGHRRLAAAKAAGVAEVPCVITNMTPKEQVSTMLTENMQRVDLTVYEQAQGFQMMLNLGDTVDGIAEKTGFSKKTVKRRLKMAELDQATLKEVSSRQISMEDFDQLAKVEDIQARNEVLKSIGTHNFDNEVQRAIKKQAVAKMLPVAKDLIKQLGAKKLTSNERYSGKYEQLERFGLEKWDGKCPEKLEGKKELFYDLNEYWGEMYIFEKKKKAPPAKKSKAQLDREKAIAEAHAQVRQLNKLHYELRRSFVESLTIGPKNREALLRSALLCGAIESCCYTTTDTEAIKNLLGVPTGYIENREKMMAEAFAKLPESEYPKLIYAIMKDGETMGYSTSYKEQMPSHHDNGVLDTVYTWLCWMGYEMSDEETSMQNGTHPVFSTEKAK